MDATNAIGCELAAEVAGKFGRVCIRAWGTSMAPVIRPGDLLTVERARIAEVSTGEVVAFARNGRLIVHRVTAKGGSEDETFVITRGDRMRRDDVAVFGPEFIGKVSRIERGGSTIPASCERNLIQRTFSNLLGFSDRATCLYLRLAAL